MATLIAIGYPEESTAAAAAEEAQRLAKDLVIEPDAIASITRDNSGRFHVTTNHHAVGGGASWGMFWGFLFGILFFVPFLGMAVGAGLGALMGKVAKNSVERDESGIERPDVQPVVQHRHAPVVRVDLVRVLHFLRPDVAPDLTAGACIEREDRQRVAAARHIHHAIHHDRTVFERRSTWNG